MACFVHTSHVCQAHHLTKRSSEPLTGANIYFGWLQQRNPK